MKNNLRYIFQLFLIIVFLAGLYIYANYDKTIFIGENMTDNSSTCPKLLVKSGNVILLYNTDTDQPIIFKNLDEYIMYLETQKKLGNNCPVLFLQEENNTQGQNVYRIRPSPFDTQGGTQYTNNTVPVVVKDASRDSRIYNTGMYPGFDPTSQYNGVYTNLDVIHDSTNVGISDNPADINWGGVMVTENAVQTGKYDMNNVEPPKLLPAPKN